MGKVLSSIACNLDTDILAASLPLLGDSKVEAIEWSFDTLFDVREVPDWFRELLELFAKEGRLIGHGVFFSLFSGRWSRDQEDWLKSLRKISVDFPFDHVTEHFGFMTGKDFHHGAPLNIPFTKTTLEIGRDRLSRIYDACQCPVGLENLAFSYSLDEVKAHGYFLEQLVEPVNGFIILDLHNLFCQVQNFSIPFNEIIKLYPLERVREIHISGGSWEETVNDNKMVRRDTHDDSVPNEVFTYLEAVLNICPNIKYVVLEQLGNGLVTPGSKKLFYQDFVKMESIVQNNTQKNQFEFPNNFQPLHPSVPATVVENEVLYQQQLELSAILETSPSYEQAIQSLNYSSLANTEWHIENWKSYMIETAMSIAQKWKK